MLVLYYSLYRQNNLDNNKNSCLRLEISVRIITRNFIDFSKQFTQWEHFWTILLTNTFLLIFSLYIILRHLM